MASYGLDSASGGRCAGVEPTLEIQLKTHKMRVECRCHFADCVDLPVNMVIDPFGRIVLACVQTTTDATAANAFVRNNNIHAYHRWIPNQRQKADRVFGFADD